MPMYLPFETDKRLPFGESGDLEDDLATWVHLGTIVYPNTNPLWMLNVGKFIDDIRELLYAAWQDIAGDQRFGIWNTRTGANIFLSPLAVNYLAPVGGIFATFVENVTNTYFTSSRQRYVAITRSNLTDVEIWKDGVLLYTINILTIIPASSVEAIHMSRRGRWLAIQYRNNEMIFEGQ